MLLLLRDSPKGPEVLLVQRNPASRFMGGAWVFPGGALRDGDADPRATGVRELEEEAGVALGDAHELVPFSRWITPVIAQPRFSPIDGREFGLGDLNPSFFLSPKKPTEGGIIWGIGPTFLLPTATEVPVLPEPAGCPRSSIDPQAPQDPQRPAHCDAGWPHSLHASSARTLPTPRS